ncbi:hypothetical protein CFOL_v3_27336 [Cephalotus follicularis]|uniref:Transposase (putative) gypsy type domain-containing protein n=1 Tax=Cephalotus follicularis TaxID=3775 RepID=A0A1Q3CUT2_CEPFO|nr:hypothetical protein CFOL_v3_27336 [Cephalotus follicularis]
MGASIAENPNVEATGAGVQVFRADFEESTTRPHKLAQLAKEYAIPGGLDLEIPADPRSATVSQPGHFVVFQDALEHGLRLPLPPFAITILRHYQIQPSMLQAQS